jgi:hypothetical protein
MMGMMGMMGMMALNRRRQEEEQEKISGAELSRLDNRIGTHPVMNGNKGEMVAGRDTAEQRS